MKRVSIRSCTSRTINGTVLPSFLAILAQDSLWSLPTATVQGRSRSGYSGQKRSNNKRCIVRVRHGKAKQFCIDELHGFAVSSYLRTTVSRSFRYRIIERLSPRHDMICLKRRNLCSMMRRIAAHIQHAGTRFFDRTSGRPGFPHSRPRAKGV